ncbi:unnamed protein product [Mytilus coruscus]|uniref:Uncharacterized protein n=1 Tax=Mytilus coruscus TaxID=42192 RepID=A0A6J8EVL8_MYTCO|nr:unnamed protein product [Mytilus coruscus]
MNMIILVQFALLFCNVSQKVTDLYKEIQDNIPSEQKEEIEHDLEMSDDGVQGWFTVANILSDVMVALKKQNPMLTCAFLKSDNAGCYHCGSLLAFIQAQNLKGAPIQIKQYNFSEAQSGKDLCDSKTSHSKLHILRYADEGHDVTSPFDMKQALESYGGLRGTFTSVVSVDKHMEPKVSIKIPGINQLNNFQFTEAGIVVRKAYKIGHGKMFENSKLSLRQCTDIDSLKILHPFGNSDSVKVGKVTLKTSQVRVDIPDTDSTETEEQEDEQQDEPDEEDTEAMNCIGFACPEPGCQREFVSANGSEDDSVVEGWALKKTRKIVRFSPKIKIFLKNIYDEGERTGKRPYYDDLCDRLRKQRTENGTKMFSPDEWLSVSQIKSLFAGFASKQHSRRDIPHALHVVALEVEVNDVELKNVLSEIENLEIQENMSLLTDKILSTELDPFHADTCN